MEKGVSQSLFRAQTSSRLNSMSNIFQYVRNISLSEGLASSAGLLCPYTLTITFTMMYMKVFGRILGAVAEGSYSNTMAISTCLLS